VEKKKKEGKVLSSTERRGGNTKGSPALSPQKKKRCTQRGKSGGKYPTSDGKGKKKFRTGGARKALNTKAKGRKRKVSRSSYRGREGNRWRGRDKRPSSIFAAGGERKKGKNPSADREKKGRRFEKEKEEVHRFTRGGKEKRGA